MIAKYSLIMADFLVSKHNSLLGLLFWLSNLLSFLKDLVEL